MRKFKLRDPVAKRMKGLENSSFIKEQASLVPSTDVRPAESGFSIVKPEDFHVIYRTDIGLIRKSNQDAIIFGNGIFGVADGMGGHNGGETASAGARDGMIRETAHQDRTGENLDAAIRKVNLELWEKQLGDADLSGMGTTLTVLWPSRSHMLIGHVGDSRAYLLRNGEFRLITDDHSIVADMVRKGILTEEQAACHPMRNYITRAVGTETDIHADILSVPRAPGDRWLVCSDGLHGTVGFDQLRELMSSCDLDEAADQMIRDALDHGGRDNISLVIIEDLTGGSSGVVPVVTDNPQSSENSAQPISASEKETEVAAE